MKTAIQASILLLVSSVFMIFHEQLMQTWRPMFVLILISLSVAAIASFFVLRAASFHEHSPRRAFLLGVLGVFVFFFAWRILWAVSEDGLVHYYLASYESDDTGGRYFYPGNSGMGYAQGLSRPLALCISAISWSGLWSVLLGIPFGLYNIGAAKYDDATYLAEYRTVRSQVSIFVQVLLLGGIIWLVCILGSSINQSIEMDMNMIKLEPPEGFAYWRREFQREAIIRWSVPLLVTIGSIGLLLRGLGRNLRSLSTKSKSYHREQFTAENLP